jgi:pimeloyl-ACP methyl ester carboxylesterase
MITSRNPLGYVGTFTVCFSTLLLLAFAGIPETCHAAMEEVSFASGEFTIVGELRWPETGGPFPAIIMISGDGNIDRTDYGKYLPLFDVFLRAGYAVLSWDKPGTGETIGEFGDGAWIISYRTGILHDAIAFLEERPLIDPSRIGAWGISQGGIVIPMALSQSESLAFAVIVSGPGVDGIGQYGYLVNQYVQCGGGSDEQGQLAESAYIQTCFAEEYQEYLEARMTLVGIPTAAQLLGTRVLTEDEWSPWDRTSDCFFDPMGPIRETTIPILALFGALDKQVDPVRGLVNYQQAFANSAQPLSQAEWIPGADHNLVHAATGCIAERNRRPTSRWLQYAPEYLEVMEQWLTDLIGIL